MVRAVFHNYLTNPPMMKTTSSESSNKLVRLDGRGVMLLPDFAKEIEMKLEDNSGSTRTQIDLKPICTRIETSLAQPSTGCATHLLLTDR